jgi:dipeptidyl aminopeptidase/acylaminoacyl peptidase
MHGILATPKPAIGAIEARVLACHGHNDPFVPPQQVTDFMAEMTRANVDWQFLTFGNCAHSFTVPTANNPAGGQVYDGKADARSFAVMRLFLVELFGQ